MSRPRKNPHPPRLLAGCPDSLFAEFPGCHCGCNACCFCGRAHPVQVSTKQPTSRKGGIDAAAV